MANCRTIYDVDFHNKNTATICNLRQSKKPTTPAPHTYPFIDNTTPKTYITQKST